jgi:radical SAM superfamily enzyme YgiQ (UPF0313 family)
MHRGPQAAIRAALIGLYSEKYPAIGESHGLSVVAGGLRASFPASQLTMEVLDMVQHGQESCAEAVALVERLGANVLAVGLPYGTFSVLREYYSDMRRALAGERPLVVLGGPIATYLSDRLLEDICPDAVVILGEADQVFPALVARWLDGRPYSDLPNLHYFDQSIGTAVRTRRALASLRTSQAPYRGHIRSILANGGQVFAEASRGCSWAACTFCLRGLTDVAGRNYEYRRKEAAVVAADLRTLYDLGVSDVTFADEDFLGSSLPETAEFVADLASHVSYAPRFDASATVHSVYSRRDSPAERSARESVLQTLAKLGLQKVFLGIESCSPGQLKRYAKGHTREEAVAAARTLQRFGIRVEIGVILFDPLCTLAEVADSLSFMRSNGLAQLASGISSELRLQVGSSYFTMLQRHEKQSGVKLWRDELEKDTLSYPYRFADDEAQSFFFAVKEWSRRLYPLYYPAKSLSRFGATGALGQAVYPLRHAIRKFRTDSCDAMLEAIGAIKSGRDGVLSLDRALRAAGSELAAAVLASSQVLKSSGEPAHPLADRIAAAAATFLPSSSLELTSACVAACGHTVDA